jgi:hypothetical protein
VTDKNTARLIKGLEQYAHDMAAAVMDSFAARVREEARTGPHRGDTMEALLATARSAEATAEGIREESARRKSPPPIEITIRDRDGKTE